MTVDVDGIKRLLRSDKRRYNDYLIETKLRIENLENELEDKREYLKKLSFYLDKSTKILEIIEMDETTDTPFKEIHKNLYATDIYADE